MTSYAITGMMVFGYNYKDIEDLNPGGPILLGKPFPQIIHCMVRKDISMGICQATVAYVLGAFNQAELVSKKFVRTMQTSHYKPFQLRLLLLIWSHTCGVTLHAGKPRVLLLFVNVWKGKRQRRGGGGGKVNSLTLH